MRLTVVPPLSVTGGTFPPVIINPLPPVPGVQGGAQLHIRATVTKTLDPTPNRTAIDVYNLSPLNRASIAGASRRVVDWVPGGVRTPLVSIDGRLRPSDPVVVDTTSGVAHALLEAGYSARLGVVASGMMSPVRNRKVGPDWITSMQSGEAELGLSQGTANKTFTAGTPASAILTYLAGTCGLTVAPTVGFNAFSPFLMLGPRTMRGRSRDGIEDIVSSIPGMRWWAERGVLWILGDTEVIPGPPVVVSPEASPGTFRTIGAPERLDDGNVRVKTLFNVGAMVGHSLIVVSSEVAGNYRIEQLTHRLDNVGAGEFSTECICRNLAAI